MDTETRLRDPEFLLLASLLYDDRLKPYRDEVAALVVGGDFYQPTHETVWQAMRAMDRVGTPVNPITVRAYVLEHDLQPRAQLETLLLDLISVPAANAGSATWYADQIRLAAVRRRIGSAATRVAGDVERAPGASAEFPGKVARLFTSIAETAALDDDQTYSVDDLLSESDDATDWVVPGLLEHGDRLILTGGEGLGKSHLLRQIAVCAAGGMDPWETAGQFEPRRSMILDAENSRSQLRAALRPVVAFVSTYGTPPGDRLRLENTGVIDLTRDQVATQVATKVEAFGPDLLVIGPLYKIGPAVMNTDEEVGPLLRVLDRIRERVGCAVLIEAHAGHVKESGTYGARDMRPRGSSALMGWPEFGYGMVKDPDHKGWVRLKKWRGDRVQRDWPEQLHPADGFRWMPPYGDD